MAVTVQLPFSYIGDNAHDFIYCSKGHHGPTITMFTSGDSVRKAASLVPHSSRLHLPHTCCSQQVQYLHSTTPRKLILMRDFSDQIDHNLLRTVNCYLRMPMISFLIVIVYELDYG